MGDGDAPIPAGLGKPGPSRARIVLGSRAIISLQRGCRGGVAALGDIELDQVVAPGGTQVLRPRPPRGSAALLRVALASVTRPSRLRAV